MKLISWNVNGIRAAIKKGFLDYFNEQNADIFCLQETKLSAGQLDLELKGYHQYWNYAEKKGYSGTAIFTKQEPLSVSYGLGIEEALKEWNFEFIQENPDFVVVGLDRNATYKSYSEALHHILAGAKFIATNPDRLLANNGTFDIGNGAVIDMLEYASGVEAIKIGKPYQIILDILLEEKNLKKEDLIFIGDNLETDIKLGYDAKIETIMVCSGVHTEKDIDRLKVYPTKVIKNLRELIK